MEFVGSVQRASHEGGLLVTFTGEAPHLGSAMETSDGEYLGRVDTVIGRVDAAMVHILPLARGLDATALSGVNVRIQRRRQRDGGEGRGHQDRRGSGGRFGGRGGGRDDRRQHRGGNRTRFHDGGNRGGRFRDGGNRRRGEEQRNNRQGGNDWTCPQCNNSNFGWRETCNRCPTPRPKGGGGGRGRDERGGGSRGSGHSGGRGGYRGGNRGGGGNRGSGPKRRGGTRTWQGKREAGKKHHSKRKSPDNPFSQKKRRD